MTFQDVRQDEESALMGETLKGYVFPYAAVENPEDIVRTPTDLRRLYPVTLVDLPGEDRSNAFIQLCDGLKYKFLWVNAHHKKYRESYQAFLKHFHKITHDIPSDLHVDHLYNSARARAQNIPWIRVILVPRSINTSHGAGYEKSRGKIGADAVGRVHIMDEILLMKVCGMPSPRQGEPLTAEMISHIHRIAEYYGMNPKDIERNITDLMRVAAFFSKKKEP